MRRNFLLKLLGMSALLMPITLTSKGRLSSKDKSLFIHHVFFWLKDNVSDEQKKQFVEGLKELVSINTIRMNHIGVPADTNRPVIDHSYQYSLLTAFDDRTGHDLYQDHPIHLKFIDKYSHLWSKVLVYDSVHV